MSVEGHSEPSVHVTCACRIGQNFAHLEGVSHANSELSHSTAYGCSGGQTSSSR